MTCVDCKSIVYHPERQEVITPVHPNRLLRWDVSGQTPRMLDDHHVLFHWQRIPPLCRVNDTLVLVEPGQTNSTLLFLDWHSWQLQQRQRLAHMPLEETNMDDLIVGHDACPEIDTLHHCPGYLVVAENFGDVQCVPLVSPLIPSSILRLKRRWTDYTGIIAVDPHLQFLIVENTDQFIQFELYRIDDLATDQLIYLGNFWGDVRCHEDRLCLSAEGDYLLHTSYKGVGSPPQAFITCRYLDRSKLQQIPADHDFSSDKELVASFFHIVWEKPMPYIQHPHAAYHPWQSTIAFLDRQTLIYGAGSWLATIDLTSGQVLAEYPVHGIIQALALDTTHRWAIVATREGVEKVQLP